MREEHRVSPHLGVTADDYDRAIRTFIPGYDRMLATIAHWLDGHVPADGLVVDLGAGTGALSATILEALPGVHVQLVDVDPAMLEVADARCAAYPGRYELRRARFDDELPRCAAVVASLALHHVATTDEKLALYRAIHDALQPGGLVVVGDALLHAEGPERAGMVRDWHAHMALYGITAEEAAGHLAQWAEEDHYVALPDELGLLAAAGFARPDCFWREGAIAVYGAFRS
jgi:tRNA (cmo5U34)-methyltransferase